jgi:glycosyltransferase involved in cell wall biosynthesis
MTRLAQAIPEFEFHFLATHLELHSPQIDAVGRFAHVPNIAALVVYLHKQKIDVLQASNLRWPIDAAKIAGVPCIVERTDGTRSCCVVSKGDLDGVVVSARGTVPYIAKFWPDVDLDTIYNSIDLELVDVAETVSLGLDDRLVIGRCSRFGFGKRLDVAIRSLRSLLDRGVGAHLVLAGQDSGLKGAKPVTAELRSLAAELGLEKHVTFFGFTNTPIALTKAFDVGICTSDPFNEGIPNSLIEPMGCGKPVVTTDVDQVRELVSDGSNGFVVPPGDPTALADALYRLVDPKLRHQMGTAARKTIERDFSFAATVEAYKRFYKKVIDGKGK